MSSRLPIEVVQGESEGVRFEWDVCCESLISDQEHSGAGLPDEFWIVSDHQNRFTALGLFGDAVDDAAEISPVESRSRFIEHDELSVLHERYSNGQALLLPTGQRAWVSVPVLPQPELCENPLRLGHRVGGGLGAVRHFSEHAV